jgi:hypothetical protein
VYLHPAVEGCIGTSHPVDFDSQASEDWDTYLEDQTQFVDLAGWQTEDLEGQIVVGAAGTQGMEVVRLDKVQDSRQNVFEVPSSDPMDQSARMNWKEDDLRMENLGWKNIALHGMDADREEVAACAAVVVEVIETMQFESQI